MKWFTHPDNVCMTYFQHLKLSLTFAYLMQKGAIKSFIHAFLPDVLADYASKELRDD